MSLTNSVGFPPLPKKNPSPVEITRTASTEKLIDAAPLILRQLGRKLEENAFSLKKNQSNKIESLKECNQELQTIFNNVVSLVKKNTPPSKNEIISLEERLKEIEIQIAAKKETLSNSEISQFLRISEELHTVISSLEDQLALQQKFDTLEYKLGDAFEGTQSAIFSDLHGWSPTAFKNLMQTFNYMIQLSELTGLALRQKSLFSPEILKQFSDNTHVTSWVCCEWFHETFIHFNHVLSVAGNQWDEAQRNFQSSPSLEDYTKMHLARKQLIDMQQVMQEMDQAWPKFSFFEECAQGLNIELQQNKLGFEERKIKLTMKQDFKTAFEEIKEAKKQLADKSAQLNKVIEGKNINESLHQAEQAFNQIDLHPQIQTIINQYTQTEKDLDCYITTKHKLCGILALPNSLKQYFAAHAFCNQEESRLSKIEGCSIDFNELVVVKMMQEGQPQPGVFSRICKAVLPDPANWSDRTKYWVHVGGLGLQLFDHISKMSFPEKPQKQELMLSREQIEQIDKETAFLGNILSDKYGALQKDFTIFENLTKKSPEIRPTLDALIKSHPQSFSDQEQQAIMSGYKAHRQHNFLTGTEGNLDWIINLIPKPLFEAKPISVTGLISPDNSQNTVVKANHQAIPTIEGTGLFLENTSLPTIKHEVVQELKQAVHTTNSLARQLRECNLLEYLSPNYPATPKALHELRGEISLMHRSLGETMMSKPAEQSSIPLWVEWSQSVQKQCHSLKHLESRVADAMMAYEEARAISDNKSYLPLVEYGNKHMNLVKQHDIVKAIAIDGVNVPMPQGVGSGCVLKFLQTHSPEIFEHWNAIRSIYANTNDKSSILNNVELLSHLDKIDQGIKNAFLKAAEDDKAFDALGFTKQTKEWLNELNKKNAYLMVRSTGAEDSKQSANAGGNASISYVKPERKELCQALGEVARSYFDTGSLQKRLNANLNPFEDELKVAVTTQELIGEEVGGTNDSNKIPISLVLFSTEPLFIGNEKFRTLRISATYGHGEGVVGNQGIAGDTALLLISAADPSKLYILYDNQEKPERLAPVRDENGKVSLEKIANTPEMANRPALSNDLIVRLYEWAVVGEKFYEGDPTDMEIVIKEGTIYPVQARPINRLPLSASYLDLKKISEAVVSPIEKKLHTSMIVPGKASVVEITNPEQILIIDTLKNAEKAFKKGQHKLIVVGQPEPANSHPVVNFSALGMPCLFAQDPDKVRHLAKKIDSTHHLASCIQSATISLWDTSKGAIEDFTSTGFVVHPAKIAISLPLTGELPHQIGIYEEAPERVQNLIGQIGMSTTHSEALNTLQALQKDEWVVSLQIKIDELKDSVVKQPFLEQTIRPIITAAETLQNKIQGSIAEVEAVLKKPDEAGRLEFLIRLKDLQTLLFQQPESSSAIAQYSLLSMQESFAAAKTLTDYQRQLPHQAHFADILLDGTQSPTKEAFDAWKDFLLALEPIVQNSEKLSSAQDSQSESFFDNIWEFVPFFSSKLSSKEISQFKTVLDIMRKGNVLPMFMTLHFKQINSGNPIETVRGVINLMSSKRGVLNLMSSNEEPIIDKLFTIKKEIQQLRNDINRIGDPKAYNQIFSRLETLVENFSPKNQLWLRKDRWDSASPLTRSLATQSMNELVDLYDTAIKTMKASSEITNDIEKTQKFKEMLHPYLKLFKDLAAETIERKDLAIGSYLRNLERILLTAYDKDPTQLKPSDNFDVSNAIFGAVYGYEPVTLEDLFTLIHQNLVQITAIMTKGLFSAEQIKTSLLPEIMKNTVKMQTINEITQYKTKLVGIDITKDEISLNFHVPLRDHSGKYSLVYHRQTDKHEMKMKFLGANEYNRWKLGAELAEIFDSNKLLKLKSKPQTSSTGLETTWNIDSSKDLDNFFEFLNCVSLITFIRSYGGGRKENKLLTDVAGNWKKKYANTKFKPFFDNLFR